MLIGNYGHDPLLGDCYEENQGSAKQAGIMMQNPGSNSSIQEQGLKSPDQGSAGSQQRGFLDRRLKPQPNQVLKCPRCESLNTKFCYYNNYSLTQPRHFCKNCRRYWTKGGALRNVPVGGGCRKNKRSKQKSSDQNSHGSDAGGLSGSYGSDCSVPNAGLQQRSLSGCSNSGMYSMNDGIDLPGSIDLTGRSGLSFSMPLGMHNFDPSALAAMNLGDGSSRHHDSTSKVDLGPGVGVAPMFEPSGGLSLMGSVNTEALSSYSMMNSLLSMELNGELKWRLQQRMSDDHDSKPNAHAHPQVFHHFDDVNLKGKSISCLSPPKSAPEPHRSFGFDHWQQTSHDGLILDPPPPVADPNCWNYSSVWPPDLPNYGPSGPQLL